MNEEQNTPVTQTETTVQTARGNGLLIAGAVGAVLVLAGLYYYFVVYAATSSLEQQTAEVPEGMLGGDYPDVVAVVNGKEVSREELLSGLNQEMQMATQQGADVADVAVQTQIEASVMDRLINTTLLLQAAERSGLVVSEEEVTAEYARVAGQFEDITAFETAIAEQGLTETRLRADMHDNLLLNAFIASDTFPKSSVSAEEIQATYDEVAATQTGLPPLEAVAAQIEAQLVTQKQQAVISAYIETLRGEATIEVLI